MIKIAPDITTDEFKVITIRFDSDYDSFITFSETYCKHLVHEAIFVTSHQHPDQVHNISEVVTGDSEEIR
jgi:hypothetical protein